MKHIKFIISSLLVTFLIWSCISWPLPMYIAKGIPASSRNTEKNNIRAMIPGDHLQFLYHLWLAKDTIQRKTRLFYNVYEFNSGNDEERRDPAMRYYFPFSLIYTIGAIIGNQAFGWNITGLFSLWVTFFFTFLLIRRYTKDNVCVLIASAISIMFPYRWITLLGGSPTGLAMMWVPVTFYGLDVMIKDKKIWGSTLAGAAIFFSGWCDPHVTFFTGMTAPCWCLISYLYHRKKLLPEKNEILPFILAAVPLFVFAILVFLQARGLKNGLDNTKISDTARDISEIAIFSPSLKGLIARRSLAISNQIYTGWISLVLLTLCFIATIVKTVKTIFTKNSSKQVVKYKLATSPIRMLFITSALFFGILSIILLASGVNNPGGVLFWLRLIKVIPPYGMIRQSAKIFILFPVIIAIFIAITLPVLFDYIHLDRWKNIGYYFIGILLLFDYGSRINPVICSLDREQKAYKAVSEDAEKRGVVARAIAIPLWPGDSHWSSLYQYYSSLYHIRMINGYRPTVREKYFKDVYLRFESFNKGGYTDKQLDNLIRRGIDYIILHEDAYPEKVSPFSVSLSLYQLLAHPRLKLFAQDKSIWAFKIVDKPEGIYTNLPNWEYHFPSRLWQAESCLNNNSIVLNSKDTSGNKYLRLLDKNASLKSHPYPMYQLKGLCLFLRIKGKGSYKAKITANQDELFSDSFIIYSEEWVWHKLVIPEFEGYKELQIGLSPEENDLDVDLIVLATKEWNTSFNKKKLVLPAPIFFHAGYTDLKKGEVILSPDRDPADAVFYGPKLPMPAGIYAVDVEYYTDAPDGTVLGSLKPRYSAGNTKPVLMTAGQPATLIYHHEYNLRFAFNLVYSRNAVIRIRNITIRKL